LKKQIDYTALVSMILVLFTLSFFKDEFTPDYLNSDSALFLSPDSLGGASRTSTIISHLTFWLMAMGYSFVFVLLPYYIITLCTGPVFSQLVFWGLLAIVIVEYIMIFMNISLFDYAIIPKINRFYHSPIITLFFIAAYTINDRIKDGK
jgi:hypothetical protein